MRISAHVWTVSAMASLAAAALLSSSPRPQPEGVPDPATMAIEYRPGAFFPPELPLHGRLKLLSAPIVTMGERARVRFEYVVGDIPIESGDSIEIWKHFTSDVEELQAADPEQPAYFSAEATAAGVEFEAVAFSNEVRRNKMPVFPYRKAAAIVVRQGRLEPGDKIYFDLGGEEGVRMQYYAENFFNFRVALTRPEAGRVLGYAGDIPLTVVGGPLARLKVKAPAVAARGERLTVEVVPMDDWVSLARNHQGLELEIPPGGTGEGAEFVYDAALQHYVARDIVAHEEGVLRIPVRTKDRRFEGLSNPIWVERSPDRRVFFGDLHQHTYLADGRGAFEELYLYARRVAMLDFGALTPHQMPLTTSGPLLRLENEDFPRDAWPELVEANKTMKGWQGFTPILAYEYSVGTAAGGHHNVFYADDEARTTMHLDRRRGQAPIAEMLELLRRSQERALVIPHIGGGPPDWEHPTDPRLERLFEIASVHGVFEESYQKHLASGQRLAATASGDTHTVQFGNANPGLIYTMTSPLTGVWSNGPSREELWEALTLRSTYGVTGNARMLLDFRVNGHPMGDELPRGADSARIAARISGTAPLVRVELLRNNEVIHALAPSRQTPSRLARISWGDNIYQRRANEGLTSGRLRAEAGRVTLERALALDNSFERVRQDGESVAWRTATTSNDRDVLMVDLSQAEGALLFRLEDPDGLGTNDVRIPLDQLERDGFFRWESEPSVRVSHPYLAKMGVPIRLFVDVELVAEQGQLDYVLEYEDRRAPQPGDYYYLRVEQVDTVQAWSSPVWAN